MSTELWLGATVVAAGLWSGLLLTVTTLLHPMYAAEDGAGFTHDLHRFLPVARRSPTNYVLVLALLVAPAGALVSLRDTGGAAFALTAAGFVLTVLGPFLTSRFLAEPNYEVIMAWDADHLPADWRSARHRYFVLNWLRGALTWAAFGLFLAATHVHLT